MWASACLQIVDNEMNPARVMCNICKSFAHKGSCLHTMTINHLFNDALPVDEQRACCDVVRMATLINKNKKKELTGGGAANANKKTKALNKKAHLARGQYASKKNYTDAMRAKGKAIAKKSAAAKKAAAKKPASKQPKKPAPKKKPAASPSSRSSASPCGRPSSAAADAFFAGDR